ncbi:tetratricopeptide repeat protein [Candidatus Sulfurimonas baltica]|uniref:Tetratricopeptide repeat protein n=1 Tax=Candidatus Sulfurimonas baltica TaxID=2740404 RepID=A0A7S7LXI9_9BACT|nr:tetratricopeptide repeat protein [Candidatus Sulfurimonas baltica]QOY53230.1 tetratricopeptide repeat protein [Candidatus Sulfurimonas baltica]
MSKTFRLFISSTFNDFRKEREVLQTKVFPHIKDYASKEGYAFQPIDLRWGVSNEAQLDQKTLELCLSEVRACKSHMHPNFLIMIGDRYGWIPLPYAIEADEYEELLSLTTDDEKQQLQEWYKKDLNQLPASYILKERKEEYEEFEAWLKIEKNIRTILQSAVNNSSLNEEQTRKYFLSATEAEVEEGIIPYINPTKYQRETLLSKDSTLQTVDPEHIFGFFRDVDKTTQTEDKFIVDDYEEAQLFKKRVEDVLVDNNTLHVQTTQTDKDTLNEEYLTKFQDRMISFLEAQVDSQKTKEDSEKQTPLQIELAAQSYFAQTKRKDFLAQESLRETIANYISDDNQQPLVIYGESGRGKSALISKAIQEAEETLQKKVLYRFVSATPNSSSSKEILTSIFEELHVDIRTEEEKAKKDEDKLTINSNENQESFEDFSYRVYTEILNIKESIVVFIDAVDQLQNDDNFLWLPQQLPSNVKIVISALDDVKYKDDSKYLTTLKTKTDTLHLIPEFSEPIQLLKALLEKEDRTVDDYQTNYFLQQFENVKSPLYVSIATQEMKNWKSGDTTQTLQNTQQGIIEEFVENLYKVYHHNEEFVNKALGYIYASRDGLSESELLQLISADEEFIKRMAPETWHDNPNKELPLVHWSRLQTQLKPFLSSKTQDGEELMYFFHREFEDVIAKLPNQREEHEAVIKANQELIKQNQDKPFNSNRWGKLYATLITEYELRYKDKEKQKEFAEFIAIMTNNSDWVLEYLLHFSNIGTNHRRYNRMHKAIAYQESCLYISKDLYNDYLNSLTEPYAEDIPANSYGNLLVDNYILALTGLSFSYSKQNREEEAIDFLKESFKITKELYSKNQTRWIDTYLMVLNNLAENYRKHNHITEAIELGEESLKILRPLYYSDPAYWLEPYISVLGNFAGSLSDQNRLEEAIELQEESLGILTDLYKENPSYWAGEYALLLINLAATYSDANRQDQVINIEEEAVKIIKELFEQDPVLWVEYYTTSLHNLAFSYENQNRLDDAIELEEESLKILKEFYREDQNQWALDYMLALNSLGNLYIKEQRFEEALHIVQKAKNLSEKYFYYIPQQWTRSYLISMTDLAGVYGELGDYYNKIQIQIEKVQILGELYAIDHERWHEEYSNILKGLIGSLRNQNDQSRLLDTLTKLYVVTVRKFGQNSDMAQMMVKEIVAIKQQL